MILNINDNTKNKTSQHILCLKPFFCLFTHNSRLFVTGRLILYITDLILIYVRIFNYNYNLLYFKNET